MVKGHAPDCDEDYFEAENCPSACLVPSGRDDPTSISNLMAAGPPKGNEGYIEDGMRSFGRGIT